MSLNLAVMVTVRLGAVHRYRNSGANIWIQLARAGGLTLDFNCAIIVLPMCRKVLGLMRATWLVKVIPFDSSIEFHKLIAYNIIIGAVLHTVGHFGNYATLPEAFATYLFETNAGITGFLIWIVMIIMYIGASERIRRGDARFVAAAAFFPAIPRPNAVMSPHPTLGLVWFGLVHLVRSARPGGKLHLCSFPLLTSDARGTNGSAALHTEPVGRRRTR